VCILDPLRPAQIKLDKHDFSEGLPSTGKRQYALLILSGTLLFTKLTITLFNIAIHRLSTFGKLLYVWRF